MNFTKQATHYEKHPTHYELEKRLLRVRDGLADARDQIRAGQSVDWLAGYLDALLEEINRTIEPKKED